jgi:hypothetical protein
MAPESDPEIEARPPNVNTTPLTTVSARHSADRDPSDGHDVGPTPPRGRPPKEGYGKGRKSQLDKMSFQDMVEDDLFSDALARLTESTAGKRANEKGKDKDLGKDKDKFGVRNSLVGEGSKDKGKERDERKRKETDRSSKPSLSDARAEHLLIAARKLGRERAWEVVKQEKARKEKVDISLVGCFSRLIPIFTGTGTSSARSCAR